MPAATGILDRRTQIIWFIDDTNVYRVTIHKTFEGNLTCFPEEDHQILTEHGFWDLVQVREHFAQHETLRVGCYVDGVLEYHAIRGEDVTIATGEHDLVEMHGRGVGHAANDVSLVPTANHRMLLRVGPTNARGQWTQVPAPALEVYSAGAVLERGADDASVAAQFTARFAQGEAVVVGGALPFQRALGITSADEVDAFLELYGRWFGAGASVDARTGALAMAATRDRVRWAGILTS